VDNKRAICCLALCFSPFTLTGTAQTPATSAHDLLKSGDAKQREWIQSELDRGALEPTDTLGAIVLANSSLAAPLIEKKIEEVLHSKSPADCFSDKSVDPNKFVDLAAGVIAYAADQEAMKAIDSLMKIDEERFGPLVASALWRSYNTGKTAIVAYQGLDLGNAAMTLRIMEWIEPVLTDASRSAAVLSFKQWWADAMVDKYGGLPTDLQWATDPIASRLKPQLAESLHNDMVRLTLGSVQKRAKN
jgi:hypothetical protein